MPTYPMLRPRSRGIHAGLMEIVFSEGHYWEEAQTFARAFISEHGMKLIHECNGPEGWLWDVQWLSHRFVMGYDDFPCETVLFSAESKDEFALLVFFQQMIGGGN